MVVQTSLECHLGQPDIFLGLDVSCVRSTGAPSVVVTSVVRAAIRAVIIAMHWTIDAAVGADTVDVVIVVVIRGCRVGAIVIGGDVNAIIGNVGCGASSCTGASGFSINILSSCITDIGLLAPVLVFLLLSLSLMPSIPAITVVV